MSGRLPTAARAAERLSALWRRLKARPFAPESPFFWPLLLAFLWANFAAYDDWVFEPALRALGYAGRYGELVNSSSGSGAAAWILFSCGRTCFAVGLVALALRLSGLSGKDIGWSRPRGSLSASLAVGAAIGAAFMVLKMFGWEPFVHTLRYLRPYPWTRHFAPITDHHFFPGDPHALVYVLQEPLFMAPLAEELFYRGLLYELFSRRHGRTAGALLSSFFFACAHFRSEDFARSFGVWLGPMGDRPMSFWFSLFLSGLLYCWLRDRRRSLAMPAAAHTAGNIVAEMVRVVTT